MTLLAASPLWLLCASSTMIATRLPSILASAMTGNFCRVVMMIFVLVSSSASRSCAEFTSIRCSIPFTCSKPLIVSCSCRSSTVRSVMTTTLWNTSSSGPKPASRARSSIRAGSVGVCKSANRCASQEIELLLPEPAECCPR